MRRILALVGWLAVGSAAAHAQRAGRAVYLDNQGVVRWKDDRQEVALFGANYVLPTASDYRAAGYVRADRKQMIDEDMAQFARMGWDGLRLTFWGDWEASDSAGNLIANDHLDLLDYLIARARERGIYMLFSPIQLYGANWPDALGDTTDPGFGRHFGKARMGTDPAAIAAQVNYLRQILRHVNPYTRVALKDEPAILFIELVNEPWHHPEDMEGSVRYIDALTDAVYKRSPYSTRGSRDTRNAADHGLQCKRGLFGLLDPGRILSNPQRDELGAELVEVASAGRLLRKLDERRDRDDLADPRAVFDRPPFVVEHEPARLLAVVPVGAEVGA